MTPDHSALINHLMLKRRCCWAPGGRFCAEGRELWLEDKAAFVADMPALTDRRHWMAMIRQNAPEFAGEVEGRVIERFQNKSKRAA